MTEKSTHSPPVLVSLFGSITVVELRSLTRQRRSSVLYSDFLRVMARVQGAEGERGGTRTSAGAR